MGFSMVSGCFWGINNDEINTKDLFDDNLKTAFFTVYKLAFTELLDLYGCNEYT